MRIGIDLGGTKIEAIALSPAGQEITRLRVATPRDYAASLDAIAGLVRELERAAGGQGTRSEEHTSELQSQSNLVCRLLLEKITSIFKRPVSSWKALNLRKTLLMASSVRLKPLNCSRLPCVYAQETLTFLLTQKKTCVKNYVQKE